MFLEVTLPFTGFFEESSQRKFMKLRAFFSKEKGP